MNIQYKTIKRIIIIGKMEDSKKGHEYCRKNGYWEKRSGPYPLAGHRVDVSRFKIVAEKQINP